MNWIDIHCHLLPAMDDGPTTMADAMAMVHMAMADGTRQLVATPHIHPGVFDNTLAGIRQSHQKFCQKLSDEGITLEVGFAAEVRLTPSVLGELRRGNIPLYDEGGSYFLLEFPPDDMVAGSLYQVELIRRAGFTPIIAHPERNRMVRRDWRTLTPYLQLGCWLQLTAASIAGLNGPNIQIICRQLLEQDWVRFIASDGHGFYHRQPILSHGVQTAAQWIGQEQAEKLVTTYPAKLLKGDPLS
ncbi:MAG: capsular biosynthesis protein [Magnetococcales bacterium]|nr:capsular biosynthesis protein [Magnetococcales bacterium]NGZ25436.1 capsular biosynthesis protein [Magnetococcales bacterium]